MAKNTKIGDIFSAKIDENSKKYLQYIISDITQLNSDVIRAFKKTYPLDANPDLSEIVKDEVDFYAHCVTKFGINFGCWEKIGNIGNIGRIDNILFRYSDDYGHKIGEEPIKISNKWYVWRINDKTFTCVGKLEGENRKAFIGIVINPFGIIELLKGNKYPPFYPDYE